MKVRILKSFSDKFNRQLQYISADKPLASKKFRKDVIVLIKKLSDFPYKHRQSIFFENEDIRNLIFKGYIIIYRVKNTDIEVFGFIKYEEFLKS